MKIYYVNDESIPVTIRLIGPAPEVINTFTTLAPQESRMFEFDAPEGAVPYVKRWSNNIVLLSYITVPVSSMDT